MSLCYKPLSFSIYTVIFYFFASVYLLSLIKATKNGGVTIDLIHRDSPLSPFYNPSKTRFELLKDEFERSVNRKSFLKLSTITQNDVDFHAPIKSGGFEYLMKIGIGTPPVELMGIADTGSDLTWIQCQPCTSCYKQKDPLFNPRNTSTYRRLHCNSRRCPNTSSCSGKNVCRYQYSYADNSHTNGDLSVETLTFGPSLSFRNVVFGCGHDNGGLFNESTSGIIGLGGGPLSIIKQLSKSIGGRFSYCLTVPDSNVTSKISFGTNAIVTGPKIVSTPLVKKQPDTYYYLTLEGISVGANRVNNVFDSKASSSVEEGNIIIDSGTTLTLLPFSFFTGLKSALIAAVKGKQVSDSQGTFQLCYQKSNSFSAPPVIVHFKGADVKLTQERTFLEVEQGILCLTFLPSHDLAIFGNLHQVNYEIGYDIPGQKVVFLPKDCSKSQ